MNISPSVSDVRTMLRAAPVVTPLAHWASGKYREEVAQALEKVATPDASER